MEKGPFPKYSQRYWSIPSIDYQPCHASICAADVLCHTINLSENITWGSGNLSFKFHTKRFCWSKVHGREKKMANTSMAQNTDMLYLFVTDAAECGSVLFSHAREACYGIKICIYNTVSNHYNNACHASLFFYTTHLVHLMHNIT